MAKRFNPKNAIMQFRHDGTKWRMRSTSYPNMADDSLDSTIQYKRVGKDEGPRDFTNAELSGTLQEFLNGRDRAHRTSEGY